MSLRDLAEMFLQRGIVFTHEAVRDWEQKLAPLLGDILRKRRYGIVGASWYVDETSVRVDGRWQYLYRAIFHAAWMTTGVTPDRITTDGHDAYPRAIRNVFGDRVMHRTNRYFNNHLEQDHRGIKQRHAIYQDRFAELMGIMATV